VLWRGSGKERRVGWSGCEYDLSRFSCWDSGLGGREREEELKLKLKLIRFASSSPFFFSGWLRARRQPDGCLSF